MRCDVPRHGVARKSKEGLPNCRRHRSLKAFEEHIQTAVSQRFATEQHLIYNFSGLGVGAVWKLFVYGVRGQGGLGFVYRVLFVYY